MKIFQIEILQKIKTNKQTSKGVLVFAFHKLSNMGMLAKQNRKPFLSLSSTVTVPIQQQHFKKHERLIFHSLSHSSTEQNDKKKTQHPLYN